MSGKSKKGKTVKNLADIPPVEPAEPREPKLKQTEIPGTERPKIKPLDDLGELYVELRNKMQLAVKKFKEEAKSPLIDLMHKYSSGDNPKLQRHPDTGEIRYRFDDFEIVLTPKDHVLKVRAVEDDEISVGAPKDDSEGEA